MYPLGLFMHNLCHVTSSILFAVSIAVILAAVGLTAFAFMVMAWLY